MGGLGKEGFKKERGQSVSRLQGMARASKMN